MINENILEYLYEIHARCDYKLEEVADDILDIITKRNTGCNFCTEYEDLPEHIINGKPVGKVFDTCIQADENGLWHLEVPYGADIGVKFCPYCGRELK
jgi:hypothetical protein